MTIQVGAAGRLDRNDHVTLDAAGNGTVTLGPVPSGQVWGVDIMNVYVEGPNTEPMPQLRVYRGFEGNPANQIDSTYNGRLNTSNFSTRLMLGPGEFLVFVWTGGQPGRRATASIDGVQNP